MYVAFLNMEYLLYFHTVRESPHHLLSNKCYTTEKPLSLLFTFICHTRRATCVTIFPAKIVKDAMNVNTVLGSLARFALKRGRDAAGALKCHPLIAESFEYSEAATVFLCHIQTIITVRWFIIYYQ